MGRRLSCYSSWNGSSGAGAGFGNYREFEQPNENHCCSSHSRVVMIRLKFLTSAAVVAVLLLAGGHPAAAEPGRDVPAPGEATPASGDAPSGSTPAGEAAPAGRAAPAEGGTQPAAAASDRTALNLLPAKTCRHEWRHGTQECARHVGVRRPLLDKDPTSSLRCPFDVSLAAWCCFHLLLAAAFIC